MVISGVNGFIVVHSGETLQGKLTLLTQQAFHKMQLAVVNDTIKVVLNFMSLMISSFFSLSNI